MAERTFAERLRPWIPALIWLVVIAWESTGYFSAERTWDWFWTIATRLFGAVNSEPFAEAHHLLRKLGHFIGYAILSYFFYLGWRGRYLSNLRLTRDDLRRTWGSLWFRRWAVLAVVMAFAVASLDELHQAFLPSRTGVFRDVVLDTIGAVFAQIVILIAKPRRQVEVREEEKVV